MSVIASVTNVLRRRQRMLMMEMLKGRGLRHASLVHQEAYIGGKWVPAASGKLFRVINPSNGEVIASVPDMNEVDAQAAIDSAYEAFQTWQRTTARERSLLLRKWYHLMEEHKEDLALIMTAEAGKPLVESRGEVSYGGSFLDWFSEEAKRIYGEVAQSPTTSKEMIFIRQPIGVASLITPWNFPNAMIARKAAAALAAGCTCVIKPAEDTPLSALAAVDLAEKAGFPKGVINVVTASRESTPAVGRLMCTSPKVGGVSFTGSTAVGKHLYELCAHGIKRIGLELGGNAPFIVFNSANIKFAVDGLMASKFRNAGQTCVSPNRVLIQEEIYDEFLEALKETISKKVIVGDGFNEEVNQGPLINESQLKRVERIVNESVATGANLVLGGKCLKKGSLFYEPTILSEVTEGMACFEEEIFGPVVALKKFQTEEEAIMIANSTNKGLASYLYSQDISQAWRVARRIEAGMVGINEGIFSCAEGAFGGVKESGIGREGSRHGIDDFTYLKYLCIGGIN